MSNNNESLSVELAVDKLLKLEDVASILALSVRSVERIISSGELQCVKIRGARRIFYSELNKYLESIKTRG